MRGRVLLFIAFGSNVAMLTWNLIDNTAALAALHAAIATWLATRECMRG